MSDQYDNTNKGAIWGNEDKTSDTKPDFKGNLNVEGVEYRVSAWKRDPGASEKAPALKFSIQIKERQAVQPASAGQQDAPELSDEIPF